MTDSPTSSVSNPLATPSANIAAVVNPMSLPAYTGPTGSIDGIVLVRGPDAPAVPNLDVRACPAALDTYGKLFRAGPRRADGSRPLADAIVVVTGYSGYYLPEKSDVQRVTIGANCAYPTRSIALTFGQRLDIANDSKLPFAPYLEGAPLLTVMVAPPEQKGEPAKVFLPRADYFPLRDQLQNFVRGDVYVLRQPLHAVSDASGHFRIDGVPTGKMKISARLAGLLGEAVDDVDVRPNVVQNANLVLTYAPEDAGGASTERSREKSHQGP
ncbi:MAG: carboxypeptidase-like regulatory domain-containing protein [Myxococcota bacterium]|nr:carboxypeptidase-like regulatory domain-containing protein [Myxococcota bacterium]